MLWDKYSDSCWRTALRHSDVLTMTGWMAPTRSRTVDCIPRQRFPSQEVIHRSCRLRARLRGCSQRAGPVAELDAWPNEAGPGFGWRRFVTVTLLPCVAQRERHCPASVSARLMDKKDYPSFICHC